MSNVCTTRKHTRKGHTKLQDAYQYKQIISKIELAIKSMKMMFNELQKKKKNQDWILM